MTEFLFWVNYPFKHSYLIFYIWVNKLPLDPDLNFLKPSKSTKLLTQTWASRGRNWISSLMKNTGNALNFPEELLCLLKWMEWMLENPKVLLNLMLKPFFALPSGSISVLKVKRNPKPACLFIYCTSSALYHLFSLCIRTRMVKMCIKKHFRSKVKYDVLHRVHEIKTAEYISGRELNSVSNSRWAYGLVLCCVAPRRVIN